MLVPHQAPERFPLKGQVTCWTRVGNHIVLGYDNARIEVRRLNQEFEVVAVGYTASPPNGLAVAKRREGIFLVVAAGEVVWFDVSKYAAASDGSQVG